MTSAASQNVDTFAPISAASQVSVTQTSAAFALPSTAGATAPCLVIETLTSAVNALFVKFGTSGAVTVSLADGMKVWPGAAGKPTVLAIPSGSTHVAIICDGPPCTVSLVGGDAKIMAFAPNGASTNITVTSTTQAVAIPTTGSGTAAINLIGLQSQQKHWYVKFGSSGAVTVTTTDGLRVTPGSISEPTVLAVPAGMTHFAIISDVTGDVRVTGGTLSAGVSASVITNAMLADMASGTVKARGTAGTGPPEDIPTGNGIQLDGTSIRTRQQMSITVDGSGLKLDGDAASPGNSKYYGTNSSGTKGFYSSDVVKQQAGNTDFAVNSVSDVTLFSDSATVAVGDEIEIEAVFTVLNNSGAVRDYTVTIEFGSLVMNAISGLGQPANATSRAVYYVNARCSVSATNLAYCAALVTQSDVIAANTAGTVDTNDNLMSWNTTTSNLTGSMTVALKILSTAATATQTLTLHTYTIRKKAAV